MRLVFWLSDGEASGSADVLHIVCLSVYTITLERIEIQPRASEPGGFSLKARLVSKFSPLAQFLRVVVRKH